MTTDTTFRVAFFILFILLLVVRFYFMLKVRRSGGRIMPDEKAIEDDGIRMLEEWFYFNTDEPRVRPYRWMTRFAVLHKSTGILHYRLGEPL
jgi:hypothetical protein